jgi:hypothetical protein
MWMVVDSHAATSCAVFHVMLCYAIFMSNDSTKYTSNIYYTSTGVIKYIFMCCHKCEMA